MRNLIAGLLTLLLTTVAYADENASPSLQWRPWSEQSFELAKRQDKLVLLDLEAAWCHWCHVMEKITYQDSAVIEELRQYYIPVRADQAAFPELSDRFEDYGWPATVIFDAHGEVIVKRRGFVQPTFMYWLLRGVREDPVAAKVAYASPEVEVVPSDSARLGEEQRTDMVDQYVVTYDERFGGWGRIHKFIHAHTLEYALLQARKGSAEYGRMARETLDAATSLLDPVWGGMYQYSDELSWKSPHYEKIMSIQTAAIRGYVLAYQQLQEPRYLAIAESIYGYLQRFLRASEGVFYTSQDADLTHEVDGPTFYAMDDEGRRALGQPTIDRNIYARENGWMISALATLHAATGAAHYLDDGLQVAEWLVKHRSLPSGGMRHGAGNEASSLGDNVAVGRAFLDLYGVTGSRPWLQRARSAADFIVNEFTDLENGGFATLPKEGHKGILSHPVKHLDGNIETTRFFNLLHHYTGDHRYRSLAEHGMRYLSSPAITDQRRLLAGVLLADAEIGRAPIHITIVGHKDNAEAYALFRAGLAYPTGSSYKRMDWWDKREGPLPNPDVRYPQLERAAAFACANRACSLPVFSPMQIASAVDRLYPRDSATR